MHRLRTAKNLNSPALNQLPRLPFRGKIDYFNFYLSLIPLAVMAALHKLSTSLLRGRAAVICFAAPTRQGTQPLIRAAVVSYAHGQLLLGKVRILSAETTAGRKSQSEESRAPEQDGTKEEEAQIEDDYYAEEPLAAKISRMIWGTIKLTFGLGILGFVGYAGYSIVTALLPGGASANAVMRRTSDILRADNDVRLSMLQPTPPTPCIRSL